MLVDARAQIERRDSQVRWCEPEAYERVDDREGLNRLLRVEVVAFRLVGEIEPRPDDGDAVDTACGDRPRGYERRERLFDREVWQERRIGREAASAKELRPGRELGAGVRRGFRRLQRPHEIVDFSNHAPHRVQQITTNGGLSLGCPRIDAAAFDQPARELQALVRARRRDAGDEVADALAQDLAGAFPAAELRAVVQRARLPGERRAEEEKIKQRVFVALQQSRADAGVAARDPRGPGRLDLRRAECLQIGRETIAERRKNGLRVRVGNVCDERRGDLRAQRDGREGEEDERAGHHAKHIPRSGSKSACAARLSACVSAVR